MLVFILSSNFILPRAHIFNYSNNSMRAKMTSLGLQSTIINSVIDDPTILHGLLLPIPSSQIQNTTSINLSTAQTILNAYTTGVHTVFTLNATLAALGVFVSALMIRHKELRRADEEEMRRRALVEEKMEKAQKHVNVESHGLGWGQGR